MMISLSNSHDYDYDNQFDCLITDVSYYSYNNQLPKLSPCILMIQTALYQMVECMDFDIYVKFDVEPS